MHATAVIPRFFKAISRRGDGRSW